ncbi:cupredoxin domain-containing protein [Candidatus Nitronereus thalassa]|uniref:Cupredoxin domain-containing protein n=1 Tax=Candidatus Nitronereus thalassa TaxID=3020898 RepID=A0ABU3K3S5_9BACT|nr:cupredoxin domain-containing protein [Candidatus Nitronereus thalassa]MDT7041042.1 cupredoxin domain-containing protein [Candidatus Nitronereus thalassa]
MNDQMFKKLWGLRLSLLVMLLIGLSGIGLHAKAKGPTHQISVTATDFKFMPNIWTLQSGQPVSITFMNHGVQEHEWVLLKQGAEVVLPFDDDDESKVYWEIESGPGATKEGRFVVPAQPGSYTIVCGKPRHIERGMKATLLVE